jgi:hypothetical protein
VLLLFTFDRLASDTDWNETFVDELLHVDDSADDRRDSKDVREDCDRCARAGDAKPAMKTSSSNTCLLDGNICYRHQIAGDDSTGIR